MITLTQQEIDETIKQLEEVYGEEYIEFIEQAKNE